jgi:DNA-binding NarL/FixJ family response regulator
MFGHGRSRGIGRADMMAPEESKLSILLVDDESDIRLLLQVRLDLEPDMVVVGSAANGDEAVDECRRLRPHLVVMDLLMPGTDGFEAIAAIHEQVPGTLIVAYSAAAGTFVDRQMAKLGVPLVVKERDSSGLVSVIRSTAAAAGLV